MIAGALGGVAVTLIIGAAIITFLIVRRRKRERGSSSIELRAPSEDQR